MHDMGAVQSFQAEPAVRAHTECYRVAILESNGKPKNMVFLIEEHAAMIS
ncbi:hypothetical protein GCM10008949_50290 [Deinococcus humi]|nr:hypothetical protein GCM10008949_50290 [Deinococcus humi]